MPGRRKPNRDREIILAALQDREGLTDYEDALVSRLNTEGDDVAPNLEDTMVLRRIARKLRV